jgi:hypothetical protein
MKALVVSAVVLLALTLTTGASVTYAQMTVNIPFKFEAGGKSFQPGEYRVAQEGAGSITLRPEPKGAELSVPFIKKLPQTKPPLEQPQLVFDMVGNFEPSYSDYVTDYLLSEVWFEGADGLLVLSTREAHQHKTIKGQGVKK